MLYLKIASIIIYAVFVIALFMVIVGSLLSFFYLFTKNNFCSPEKNKRNNRNIKRWKRGIRISLGILFMGSMLLGIVWQTNAFHKEDIGSNETEENVASVDIQDTELIANEFRELQQEVPYTKWEEIIRENLDFAFYGSEKGMKDYHNHNTELLLMQFGTPSVQRIQDLMTDYAEYFVEPKHTLGEINAIIISPENTEDIITDIHKEEVVLYLGDFLENLNRESVCQAGRAAHEVVDCLWSRKDADVKDIILYAAVAIELYRYALHLPSENMKSRNKYDEFILYRMGMLYETLAYCELLTGNANSAYTSVYDHFLLEAESLFALATVTGAGKDGIQESQIYHVDYYRGQVLFRLYEHMDRYDVRDLAIECIQNYQRDTDDIPKKYQLRNAEQDCINMLEILQKY